MRANIQNQTFIMKPLLFSILIFCTTSMSAQKSNVYEFFVSELGGTKTLTVKGDFLGKFYKNDYYLEKTDALNHKFKKVEFSKGQMYSMNSYEINETNILVSNLRVKEEKIDGATFYTVAVETNNDKKPIMYKRYLASKGAFNSDMDKEFKLNIPFATKAKAEAFIKDVLAAGLR
jgi:hypothetical protein